MKVHIRTSEGRNFTFPVPMGLVRFGLGCGHLGTRIARRYLDEQTLKYIDCVDFRMLSQCFRELKVYRGLTIVDVRSSTGEEVTITV